MKTSSLFNAVLVPLLLAMPLHGQTPAAPSNPPAELTAARKAFEARVLAALTPLDELNAKFLEALARVRAAAAAKKDNGQVAAADAAMQALQRGLPVPESKVPDLERLRGILSQQTTLRTKEAAAALAPVLAAYRTELDTLKARVGSDPDAAKHVADEAAQAALDAQAVGAGLLPWRSGAAWTDVMSAVTWQGRRAMERTGSTMVLMADEREGGPKLSTQPVRTPFEMEYRVIPDTTNVRFYYAKCIMIFNWERNPQQFEARDPVEGKNYPMMGKSLKPGVEQTLLFRFTEAGTEVLVDGQPFYERKQSLAGLEAPIGIGPANGSKLQVLSARLRRPGQIIRVPVTVPAGIGGAPVVAGSTPPGGRAPAGKDWPRVVSLDGAPEVSVVMEDEEKKIFVYRSPNYEFVCDSKLGVNVVKEFGRVFEVTHLANCLLPLDLKPEPEKLKKLYTATIYTNESDYLKSGGVEGSAGVYSSGKKSLMVPLVSLGVKMFGSRVTIDYQNKSYSVLVHEITHQVMNRWLSRLPTWLIEGSAEYVSYAKYENGRLDFSEIEKSMKGATTLLHPAALMSIEGAAWTAALTEGGSGLNYRSAAYLTYYFYRLDDKKDGAHMVALFRDLEQGVDTQSAINTHLIRGRSAEALEKDITTAYRKEGVKVEFVEAPPPATPATSK